MLDYDSDTNTYTLSAYISGKNGVDADLVLEDATLIFNNTASNKYYIKTWCDLVIEKMIIKASNPFYSWKIHAYARCRFPQ